MYLTGEARLNQRALWHFAEGLFYLKEGFLKDL